MTRREAQEILLSYRPGREPADDPQVAAALELVRTDPELQQWYEQHRAWDAAVRGKLHSLPVPPDLKYTILAGPKIIAGPAHWWQRPAWIAAAAAVLVLMGILGVLLPKRPAPANAFTTYEAKMVGTALRDYQMDIQTNNMQAVRAYLAARGAPSDYSLPPGVEKLTLAGCKVLDWQGKPVSMLCFDRTPVSLAWVFVMKRADFKDGAPAQARFEKVITCATASWSDVDAVYLLASETDEDTLRKLL